MTFFSVGAGIYCQNSTVSVNESSIYGNIGQDDIGCYSGTSCVWSGLNDMACTSQCKRDVCSVCNGTAACVGGCDNEPWSTLQIQCGVCGGNASACQTTVATTTPRATTLVPTTLTGVITQSSTGIVTANGVSPSLSTTESTAANVANSGATLSSSTQVIIGVVVSGVVAIIVLGIILFVFCRRKGARAHNNNSVELQDQLHVGRMPTTGKSLQSIEVHEKLGGGQFGEVYKGRWQGTTDVALKKLRDMESLEDFQREATMLQSLTHPNIVQFLGLFTDTNQNTYIVTEYLAKGSLDSLLRKEKQHLTTVDLLGM